MDTAELLSRFPSQSVLVLGDVFLDEFLSGDCSRLSPEAPVPILKIDDLKTRRALGGAANTAATAASLVGQGQQLLRLDYEETPDIGMETAGRILAAFRAHLPKASIVVLSDYAKGFFNLDLTQSIIREAHAAGREVLVDPRPQHAAYYT